MSSKKQVHTESPSWLLPLFFLIVGSVLIVVSSVKKSIGEETLKASKALAGQYAQGSQEQKTSPVRITITGGVDAEIESLPLVDSTWPVSDTKAIYLLQSSSLGAQGNSIIYGHNTSQIFGKLRRVKGAETVTITLSDGSHKKYVIRSIQEVSPTDESLLQPTSEEILTLYTCSGFLDSKRFVVRAVPIP